MNRVSRVLKQASRINASSAALCINGASQRSFGLMTQQGLKPNKMIMHQQIRGFSAKPDMITMTASDEWDGYLESATPIILQAGASWCGPCNMLKPMLTKTSKDFGEKVDYVYMDIDQFPEIAEMLEIQHIPKTFMIYKGELVDQFGGVPQDDAKITQFFQRAQDIAEGKENKE